MKELVVTPHEGIGPLKLGMTPEEILNAIYQMQLELPDSSEIHVVKRIEEGILCGRYFGGSFFFLVQYQNNSASEIAINSLLREYDIPITLYDIDVFKTTAMDLLAMLKPMDTYTYDLEDEELSTNYEFQKLGIRLWREDVFHPKLLSDQAYMEEMALVIEEQYQYEYFQIIAVR